MKKKLLLVVIAILCIATMCFSLIGCSNTENVTNKEKSSFSLGEEGAAVGQTKQINAYSTDSFKIVASENMTKDEVSRGVVVSKHGSTESWYGDVVSVGEGTKTYKLMAPTSGYTVGNWYVIELKDSRLSFVAFEGYTKLRIHIVESGIDFSVFDTTIAVDSIYLSELNTEAKTFKFNQGLFNTKVEIGNVLLVEGEDGKYEAYKVVNIQAAANDSGFVFIKYDVPEYNEVYTKLVGSDTSKIGTDVAENVEFDTNVEQLEETLLAMASVSFDVSAAKFTISGDLVDDAVVLKIRMTIPDIVPTTDGSNKLDLGFEFTVKSKITSNTDISIGSLVAAKDQGLTVKANFDNDLTFRVEVVDEANVASDTALDEILNKVKDMIQKANDGQDDVEIKVFNWIVPIGNGVADVKFNVSLVMDFSFSGKLGVESTTNVKFDAVAKYDPNAEDGKKFTAEVSKPVAKLDSISADISGNIKTVVGIKASVEFELLGGVLSIGVSAMVGNYNNFYGVIESGNLLADEIQANGGYYFEGGLCYRVDLLYGIAKIKNGAKTVAEGDIPGTQYDAGSVQEVVTLLDTEIELYPAATEIALACKYNDVKTGDKNVTGVVDTKLIKLVDGKEYVAIEDGKISLTEKGFKKAAATGISNVTIVVEIGMKEFNVVVNAVKFDEIRKASSITVDMEVTDAAALTATYVDGTPVDIAVVNGLVSIANPEVGVIIIYENGVAVKAVNVVE